MKELGFSSETAKENFFNREYNKIMNICMSVARRWVVSCNRAYEAKDLAQVAIIKVWKALDKNYDSSKPLKPFVYKIAVNTYKDIRKGKDGLSKERVEDKRRSKRRSTGETRDYDSAEEVRLNEENEARAVYLKEITLDLEPLLSRLTIRERKVIEMSFGLGDCWWEMPDDIIADELGITRQTVISDRKKAILDMHSRVSVGTAKVA